MKIYNASGIPLSKSEVVSSASELPITKSAQHTEELMKANHITLTWDDVKKYGLEVGDYIIPYPNEGNGNDNRYPLRFMLLEPYEPQQVNEQKFHYEVDFQHPVMWLSKVMCILVTDNTMTWEEAKKKTDWAYTGNAAQIASYIVDCINWIATQDTLFNRYIGNGWVTEVSEDLASSATVTISGLDIMSAATQVANAFDCEFHFDFENKIFRVGDISYGTKVNLKTGVNVGVASVSNSKEEYYNTFSVKGSTRNLSQPTPTGEHAQSTERLTLDSTEFPDSIMYTDKNGNIITKEQFIQSGLPMLMKELIFEDVYPKIELYVYNARERRCYLMDGGQKVLDENDQPIQYSKWYIRLAYPIYDENGDISEWRDFTVDENLIIEGQTLSISFLANENGEGNSLLAGQEFEVVYFDEQTTEKEDDDVNPAGFTAQEGDYRIVFTQNGNIIIPTTSEGGMYPYMAQTPGLGNDMATLYNIYVSDSYKETAQSELKSVATRKVKSLTSNLNNYTFNSIEQAFISNNYNLHVGRAVIYNDGQDLNLNGTSVILDTHIIKIVKQVDFPFQQEITVGNKKIKGSISSLRDKVDSIIASGIGTGGSFSSFQFLSMLKAYGGSLFLRKDIDDVARGTIDFLKGIQVGTNFISGLLGEGGIFRKDADGTTYIETDRLYVRLKAYFDEIEVKKYEHSGGNRIASKVGNKTVKVVKYDSNGDPIADDDITTPVSFYRCYIKLSETDADGNTTTTSNDWKVGDLARSQEFNIGNNGSEVTVHGYWREVVGVGATADADGLGYIDLSATNCMSGSNIPQPQDDIIQLGSTNDDTRRGAIIEYSTGSNAPAYQIYQGIGSDPTNRYTLEGKNYITIGYNGSTHKAEIIDYGDAYFGDRPSYDGQGHDLRRSYLEYDSTTGQMTIKADLKITAPVTNTETDLVDWIYGDFKNIEQLTQLLNSIELDFGAIEWREGELANNADLNAMIQGGDTTASSLKTTMTSNFSLLQSAYQSLATAINNVKNAGTVSDQTLSTIQGLYNTYKAKKLTTETSVSSVSDYLLHYNYQGISDLDYLKQALQEDTQVTGGLIQSSLLSLGYHEASTNVYKTMAGLNGIYDSTKIGNGIAAWYGGAMTDIEGKVTRVTSPSGNPSSKNYYEYDSTNNIYIPSKDTSVVSGKTYYKRDWDSLSDSQKKTTIDYAKSLFRMDGTGYVASGNISWDSLGRVTLKNLYTDTGDSIDQLLALFSIGGTIPTNAYITPAYPFNSLSVLVDGSSVDVIEALQKLQQLFVAHYKEVNGVQTNELESIEATAPLWSQGEVSALGYDGSGGGGGGGVTVYDGLDSTNPNIALSANQGRILKGLIDNKDLSAYALKSELATVATSGSYNDLTNKPTIPAAQIQSNWTQTNTSAKDYIKNKPTIPAAQIQSDWNQTSTSAKDYIKNKPTNVSAFTNDANYATQTWVTNKGYATTSAMNTELAKYLPLAGGTMSNTNLVTNLNADLLDGKHASELFTDLSNSGNNISLTIGGTTNTLQVAYAEKSSAVGELKYIYFSKNDNSGYPQLILISDVSDWYSRTSSSDSTTTYWGIVGNLIAWRAAGMQRNYNCRIIAAVSYYRSYYRLQSDNSWVQPLVVSYDSKYYLALKLTSATQYCYFLGYTHNLLDTFIKLNYTSSTALPSGVEIIYENEGIPYQATSITASSTITVEGLLTANGNIKTDSYIEIGDYRIVADTANTALKVVHKNGTTAVNFYATGENSALGVNTSGGGGGMDIEAMWAQLGNSDASRKINYVHIQDALTNNGYATQSWVNQQGFLTSYTETDPVFTASAAHGITSSDITSWNNKVSNVQANWNATSGLAVILNKPTLATVATSGKYSDLTGKPTNVSTFTNDANYVTSSSLATTLASYAKTSDMNTELAKYLPLTGGTLSGNLSIERAGTTTAKVTALNTNGSVSIYQGTGNNRGLYDDTNSKWIVGTNGTNSFLMEGNVGIGTTSPSYKLHVDGTAYASSAFDVATGTTTDTLGYKVGGGTVVRGTSTSVIISPPSSTGAINFYPKGSGDTTGRSTIDNDGKFGINTNTPSYQLHVNGTAYATHFYLNGDNYLSGNSSQAFFTVGSVSPLVIGETYIRRGTTDAAAAITLGTSNYRWANLYSVLGNFSGQITSSVATGTSPLSVASTTLNENLNADLLDGYHATEVPRLGWTTVSNATSGTNCKWYSIGVPTSNNSWFVYDIIVRRNLTAYISYYRLSIHKYADGYNIVLMNQGIARNAGNQTHVCVGIDASGNVYIQHGTTGTNNYLSIRPLMGAGSINTTEVGTAAFGTANGFTAVKTITDAGYVRVLTNGSAQATTYDGVPAVITSLQIGNAYIWWDDTNSCLRITGANSSGQTASVVVNVNVSGEVTALKTS